MPTAPAEYRYRVGRGVVSVRLQFTVHLGKTSEVLWIEDSTMYFRRGHELHRARIDNDALVDATLLVSDFKVNFIHWAFRGSSE